MKHYIAMMAVIAATVAIPVSSILMPAQHAEGAQPSTHVVNGYVYDSGKAPVAGASVTVKVFNGPTLTDTETTTSLSNGLYSVTIGPNLWDAGYTITIDASKDTMTGSNQTTCNLEEPQYLNVTLTTVIPEFNDLAPVVGGMLVIAAVLATLSRRRSAEE